MAHQTELICTLVFHQQIFENSRAGIHFEEGISWLQVTTGFTLALGLHSSERGLGTTDCLALVIVTVVRTCVVIQPSKVSKRDLYLPSGATGHILFRVLADCDCDC